MSSDSSTTASSEGLPASQYEEDRLERLNQLENSIAVAKAELKAVGDKLRKKKRKLKAIKEDIVKAQSEFWKIDAYVQRLERELQPLLKEEKLKLPNILTK